jgi:hypothetical protein
VSPEPGGILIAPIKRHPGHALPSGRTPQSELRARGGLARPGRRDDDQQPRTLVDTIEQAISRDHPAGDRRRELRLDNDRVHAANGMRARDRSGRSANDLLCWT